MIKNDDLVAATNGRSFWILDDLSPLRQAAADLASSSVHLFTPAVAWRTRRGAANPRYFLWYGENAPDGAILNYYLKAAPKDPVSLEILDSKGKVIRKYSSKKKEEEKQPSEGGDEYQAPESIPDEAGMNRFVWDLRYEAPVLIPGQVWDSADVPKGTLALPGDYKIRLIAEGKTITEPLTVKLDPRVKVAPEALTKQFNLSLKIRDEISLADTTVNEMNSVKEQFAALRKRIGSDEKDKDILDAFAAIEKKIEPIDSQLWQGKMKASEEDLNYPDEINDQLKGLAEFMEGSDTEPTSADYAAYEDLSHKVTELVGQWKEIKAKDLTALNEQIRRSNIPPIAPAPPLEGSH
jgi:hypothetical protein